MQSSFGHKQTLFANMLLRGLVKLPFKKSKKVTFTYKKVVGKFLYILYGKKIFIYIFKGLR